MEEGVKNSMKPESMKLRDLVPNNSTSQKIQDTFSFVTYNVLADCHVQTDYASIYDPQHINAEFRHKQIIKELEYLDGDIVCLQEVSPDFYERQLRDYFTSRGFKGHFIKRFSDRYDEGCATFYRSEKFTCTAVQLVELSKVTNDLFKHVDLDDEMEAAVAKRYLMHDVAIITELTQNGSDHVIAVANTHVDYGFFKKPDLQILQIACLKWILNKKFDGSPALLCGDFNMSPDSPQYVFSTEDILSDEQWKILQETAQIQSGLVDVIKKVVCQSHGRSQFKSMYKHLKGQEPEVTCVDYMYRLCLDYVFYREPISLKSCAEKESKALVSNLEPLQVLDTLPLDHILKDIPISQVFSSDHFPLLVKFAIKHIPVT